MLLSILILSCPSRRKNQLQYILDKVETQIQQYTKAEIEVLVLYDNKKRSVGEKRNNLMNIANGKYICFLDDDDDIADDYISKICDSLLDNPEIDSLTFGCKYTDIQTHQSFICKYSIHYKKEDAVIHNLMGHPHICPIKKELAIQNKYLCTNWGEDRNWSSSIMSLINKEIIIDDVLYFYNFNRTTSETIINLTNNHLI